MPSTPSTSEESRTPASVRVLAYNIRHAQGVGGLLSNPRVARVIAEAECDVAGLNEVWRIRKSFDQPTALGELTGMEPVFHSLHAALGREIGNLALVRPRVVESRQIPLCGRREPRGCLLLDLDADGCGYTVALTHLSLHRATRRAQLETLASELPRNRPLLLLGDFNCTVAELQPLASLVTLPEDVPPTYPSVMPFRALDHVGFSRHWDLVRLETIASWASDHRPLLAELVLAREGAPA